MPRIPDHELERLKTGVSLVRLIEASGVKLEKRGKDHVGRCPFHADKTPSLVVSPEKNLWNCLGACGTGGDVIAWVMKAEGVSFRHAVELLQNDYAPKDAARPVTKSPVAKSTVQKLEPLKANKEDAALLRQVIDYYHETLKTSAEAHAYLAKRGLDNAEMIERFKLGLSNRTLGYRLPAKNRAAGADLRGRMQKIGILRESGHEHFAGSLVIPVIDAHGAVKEAYGRKLLDNLRKGTPKHLYLPGPHPSAKADKLLPARLRARAAKADKLLPARLRARAAKADKLLPARLRARAAKADKLLPARLRARAAKADKLLPARLRARAAKADKLLPARLRARAAKADKLLPARLRARAAKADKLLPARLRARAAKADKLLPARLRARAAKADKLLPARLRARAAKADKLLPARLRARAAKADKPTRGVFNIEAFGPSDEMIICESLIDALTFWAAGFRNVTSAYGTNGFTDELLQAFKTNNIKRALIAFDRDAAGDKAAGDVGEQLMAAGVECYRIEFPKGMDANAYALNVTPAAKSLGALIRSASWMGNGEKPLTPEPAATLVVAAKEENPTEPSPLAANAAPTEEIPEPAASPVPAAAPEIAADIADHEINFDFADRHWRVRGLAKNMSYETLRVNVLVRRAVHGAEAFHLDTLDLYNAKHRAAFVAQGAGELGLPADVIKGDLGRVLLKLEELQDEQIRSALAPSDSRVEITEADRIAALDFLKSPDLLTRIADDAEACGIVGERANVLAAYLACISRKLDKPLAVLVQSTSAAGKSVLMDAVLDFVPQEERVQYAAMTGQALFYLGETTVKHKVLAIAEEEGAREASYALKLLQSQGDLSIASTGKDPVTGKLITQDYRVEGPVALMMTTTAIDLDEELKNRCLVLSVNETRAQTAAIHQRQRFEETLEGLLASQTRAAIIARHQNAQRLLRPLRIVNPYAEQLTFLDDKTQHRRDHKKYLGLIRTIALLHQHQRAVKNAVRPDGEAVEYIEVTLDDIAAANALAHDVLGRTLDELPPQTRALLTIIHEMVRGACEKADIRQSDYRFTRRDIREASGWGHTQLRVHLSRLQELEYLIPHRGTRGSRFVYELSYEGAGDDGDPFMMGLIDVEHLRNNDETASDLYPYDGKFAG